MKEHIGCKHLRGKLKCSSCGAISDLAICENIFETDEIEVNDDRGKSIYKGNEGI